MHTYKIIRLLVTFLFLFIGVHSVHAETLITDGYLPYGGNWIKSESPYILSDDVFVPSGYALRIDPGVEVRTSSSSLGSVGIYSGGIMIEGTEQEPVHIEGLSGVTLTGGDSTITYTHFKDFSRAVHVNSGVVEIKDSVFDGGQIGIGLRKATSTVTRSVFKNLNEAVHVFSAGGVFQVNTGIQPYGIGGIGDALDSIPTPTSSIAIHNNSFAAVWGIKNDSTTLVDGQNNWWGSKDGPGSDGSALSGSLVNVQPWLEADPNAPVFCCSNILFIPGLEASRLQVDENGIFGTSKNQLWEPNRNDDVRKLYLDANGKSILSNIHTNGVIDSVFGYGIYKNFIVAMDSLVSMGTIHAWKAYPYDWRLNIDSVADDVLINEIITMASSSLTKKVTIVAHSNGGLVTKLVTKKLEERGFAGVIDKVILVAVPELGTPQALSALLYGDGQRLGWGTILTKTVAQKLAINMPSAYSLLPSSEYFNKILDPIIKFASSTVTSFDGFKNFLGIMTLNTKLLGEGFATHGSIDTWKFPDFIKTVSIAESGVKTPQTIQYEGNSATGSHTTILTRSGDGTVIVPSATISGKERYVFDADAIDVTHANILQSASVISAIKKEVNPTSSYESFEKDLLTDIHKYDNVPIRSVGVHSPVELHAYDAQGRHTGKIPNPNPDSDLEYYEENAKGIQFDIIDGDEFIHLDSPTSTATIVLKGTGVGSFMLDDRISQNDSTTSYTAFAELPVTPLLSAQFELSTSSGTSTGGILHIDIDGDGKNDATATSGTAFDPHFHLISLRKVVIALDVSSSIEKKMLKRIDMAIADLYKGKIQQAKKVLTSFEAFLDRKHILRKELSDKDRNEIISSINLILDSLN